jgi:hypothetical protein
MCIHPSLQDIEPEKGWCFWLTETQAPIDETQAPIDENQAPIGQQLHGVKNEMACLTIDKMFRDIRLFCKEIAHHTHRTVSKKAFETIRPARSNFCLFVYWQLRRH